MECVENSLKFSQGKELQESYVRQIKASLRRQKSPFEIGKLLMLTDHYGLLALRGKHKYLGLLFCKVENGKESSRGLCLPLK